MVTEEDKNELYIRYKRIVFYVANNYRHLDSADIEEIRGWGFVGFVEELNKYAEVANETDELIEPSERHTLFPSIAFPLIRGAIRDQYLKRSSEKGHVSLDSTIDYEDSSALLSETIAYEKRLDYRLCDIVNLLREALKQLPIIDRKTVTYNLMGDDSLWEFSKKFKKPKPYITRAIRRGQALIKKYLADMDIIVEQSYADLKPVITLRLYKSLSKDEYRKFKYIRTKYPFLSVNQIAEFLDIHPYTLLETPNYPTYEYRRVGIDETIEEEVYKYAIGLYLERFPSEVRVTKVEKIASLSSLAQNRGNSLLSVE